MSKRSIHSILESKYIFHLHVHRIVTILRWQVPLMPTLWDTRIAYRQANMCLILKTIRTNWWNITFSTIKEQFIYFSLIYNFHDIIYALILERCTNFFGTKANTTNLLDMYISVSHYWMCIFLLFTWYLSCGQYLEHTSQLNSWWTLVDNYPSAAQICRA